MPRFSWAVVPALALGCAHAAPPVVPPATCPPCPERACVVEPRAKDHASDIDQAKDALIRYLDAGNAPALFAMFTPPMKEALPLHDLERWARSIVERHGTIAGATAVAVDERRGKYRLHAEHGDLVLDLVVGAGGEIAGLRLTEPEPAVAQSTIPLGLPFRDRWFVVWGGDTPELNHHVEHPSQRRAADLVVVDAGGKSFRGDGKRNEDYFAYGQEIRAAADGKVVTVIDGVPDNEPGSMNPYVAPGNLVIVEHEPKVYSAYAHLEPHSVRVKVNAKVRRGQVLGLCGNTGNSSEPHLHFQLQDGPLFEKSWGIEASFTGAQVIRDGKPLGEATYVFRKGDTVVAPKSK